jgi:hypothetical protein
MSKPFICPHCGAHDYIVILTGCTVTGATIEEAFTWDDATSEYVSSGSVIVENDELENEGGQAVCSACQKDVSDAVAAYEGGGETEAAQA